MTTATARTVDLLQRIDCAARDAAPDCMEEDGELLALRHLVECLTRIAQQHTLIAPFIETYAARAAEALALED